MSGPGLGTLWRRSWEGSRRRYDGLVTRRRQLVADVALLLVALVWGSTFVMVKDAVSAFPAFAFLAVRFTCAALALAPVVLVRSRLVVPPPAPAALAGSRQGGAGPASAAPLGWVSRLGGPILAGVALFAGFGFQTLGLQLTTPAKAGFITGLSVVVVPVIAALALRQRLALNAWLGVTLATLGLALLTLQRDLVVEQGDLLVFGCALAFAAQILLTGLLAGKHDPLRFTLIEIITVALLSGLASFLFEPVTALPGRVLLAAAFTGVLATSVAFGVQTAAQRSTTSTHTALIFATEPVFAALFSFILIGEVMAARQLIGSALILSGMVVAELKRPA